jgi:hypothetical protein
MCTPTGAFSLALMRTSHPHLFSELRKRNERRAKVAKLLETRHRHSPGIARVVQLHRKQRKAV